MKQLLLFFILLLAESLQAQKTGWFFLVSAGYTVGGPGPSIKKAMINQGFDEKVSSDFFGMTSEVQYPLSEKGAAILFQAGYEFSPGKSFTLLAGRVYKCNVSGFQNEPNPQITWFGLFPGYSVMMICNVWEFSPGYQYRLPGSPLKLGAGPSILYMPYSVSGLRRTTFTPGANLSCRLSMGKEKRTIGIEAFIQGRIAPDARVNVAAGGEKFQLNKVNMSGGSIGVCVALRGSAKTIETN